MEMFAIDKFNNLYFRIAIIIYLEFGDIRNV